VTLRTPADANESRTARWARAIPGHLPAFLAFGVAVLYLLGVVTTIGALRASGVDARQGLPLVPLEDHLLRGVSILVSPWMAAVAAWLAVVYLGASSAVTSSRSQSGPFGSAIGRRVYSVVLLALAGFLAVALPWGLVLLLALFVGIWIIGMVIPRRLGGPWGARVAEVYVIAMLVAWLLTSGLDAYFRSDPFPKATIRTKDGTIEGTLVGSNGGLIYLAPDGERGLYRAIPVDRVVDLVVVKQKRPKEPSVLNLIGVDWPHPRNR